MTRTLALLACALLAGCGGHGDGSSSQSARYPYRLSLIVSPAHAVAPGLTVRLGGRGVGRTIGMRKLGSSATVVELGLSAEPRVSAHATVCGRDGAGKPTVDLDARPATVPLRHSGSVVPRMLVRYVGC